MVKRLIPLMLICSVTLAFGCGSEEDKVPDQRQSMENYLTSRSMDYEQVGGVYRHIANALRAGYQNAAIAELGDSLYYDFEAFTYANGLNLNNFFYTNKPYAAENFLPGLNVSHWSFDPVGVRVGDGSQIAGVNNALEGCREGDSVVLFISSDLGYGKKPMGTLDHNQPIVFILNINDIKPGNE